MEDVLLQLKNRQRSINNMTKELQTENRESMEKLHI